MTVESSVVPSDEELSKTVVALREAHPSLGVVKLLAQLKVEHPTLSVSEKRLRKTIAQLSPDTATSTKAAVTESNDAGGEMIADTGLDPSVDVSGSASKVKVKMFKGGKGKGLVAREKILEGEVLWSEDPWVTTTSPQINEYITKGGMCTHCMSILNGSKMSVACQHCQMAGFCNRLCYSRREISASHHDLLCPGLNPGCDPLLAFIRQEGFRDLECVARIIALWRGLRESGQDEELKSLEERVWKGMARVNQVDKLKERKEWSIIEEPKMATFHRAHTLLLAALNPSENDRSTNAKTFRKLLRKRGKYQGPLSEEEEARWFSFESFCQLLGLAGLNQEDSGGLYAIHAHLNHDCVPNVRVRNLPKDYAAPEPPSDLATRPMDQRGTNRLTMIARRTIHPGEELTIPYVNFNMPRSKRRDTLREIYGFWCQCNKCKREEGMPEVDEEAEEEDHGHQQGHQHAHEHGPGCSHD